MTSTQQKFDAVRRQTATTLGYTSSQWRMVTFHYIIQIFIRHNGSRQTCTDRNTKQ